MEEIKTKKEAVEKIEECIAEVTKLSKKFFNVEKPFYNEKWVEIIASYNLGHNHNNNPQGNDAVDENNNQCEYKSISKETSTFQWHWLSENKMKKLKETKDHYFIVRGGDYSLIQKIYSLPTECIFKVIDEKSTGGKSISGHKSLNLKEIKKMGAKLVWNRF